MSSNNLIFIGTLHAGFTPIDELAQILDKFSPDQLLIEIAQADIDANKIDSYPPEMKFALEWAKKHNVDYAGFDTGVSVLAEGKTQADNEAVIDEEEKVIREHDWKDFNKKEYLDRLHAVSDRTLIDWQKWDEREQQMTENIRKTARGDRTVVLTGAGHIDYFTEAFTEAEFPFRT